MKLGQFDFMGPLRPIYWPPTPGRFGSVATDWADNRLPRDIIDATAQAQKVGQLVHSPKTGVPYVESVEPIPEWSPRQPLTIDITGGREMSWWEANQGWVLPVGFILLFMAANR